MAVPNGSGVAADGCAEGCEREPVVIASAVLVRDADGGLHWEGSVTEAGRPPWTCGHQHAGPEPGSECAVSEMRRRGTVPLL
jgi:hypothetical protein